MSKATLIVVLLFVIAPGSYLVNQATGERQESVGENAWNWSNHALVLVPEETRAAAPAVRGYTFSSPAYSASSFFMPTSGKATTIMSPPLSGLMLTTIPSPNLLCFTLSPTE